MFILYVDNLCVGFFLFYVVLFGKENCLQEGGVGGCVYFYFRFNYLGNYIIRIESDLKLIIFFKEKIFDRNEYFGNGQIYNRFFMIYI